MIDKNLYYKIPNKKAFEKIRGKVMSQGIRIYSHWSSQYPYIFYNPTKKRWDFHYYASRIKEIYPCLKRGKWENIFEEKCSLNNLRI